MRTWDEQKSCMLKGKDEKGKIVTNAKAGDSWHNYGLAIDICILFDTNNDGHLKQHHSKLINIG